MTSPHHARIAFADPPYPGQSKKHYGDHPDYASFKDGLIVLTPKGYMTRSRNEVRRSKGGQRCDTD